MKINSALAVVGTALALTTELALAVEPTEAHMKEAAKLAAELCSACHGPGGQSANPTFPRLAGQPEQYIENQLKAFRERNRAEPDAHDFMWGIASRLNDNAIDGLAHYYEIQPAAAGKPGDPKLVAKGKELFDNGVAEKKIPACASCHGVNAEGSGYFPRLAGQHAPYLVKQLLVIQSALRKAPVMHGVVKDMTRAEMEAVAAFLQSK